MKAMQKPIRDKVKLGKAVSFKTGKLDSNAATPNGEYPFFTCSQETFRTDTYSFDTECVLLAGNNANGIYPLKFFSGKFDAYQRTYVIRSNDTNRLNNRFLYYALRLKLDHLRSISTGAATKFLTLTILNDIDLELPSPKEQQHIVGILSAYDDLIENNTKRIQILEEIAQRIYEEWFVRFRFPGHGHVKMVESELGLIPEGWQTTTFEKECNYISRGVTPKYTLGSGRFIINQRANQGGYIERNHLKELSPELKIPGEKYARVGDLLVNCLGEGTIGRVTYFTEHQHWAVDQHMTICRSEKNPEFVNYAYFYMSSFEGQRRIDSVKTGATNMTMFNISTLRNFSIIKPESSLLLKFYETSKVFWEQRRVLNEKNHNLRKTRDLLLPKLISGEIDVSNFPEPVSD